jgi:transcriptional regulator with XRE-family HTH domain
VDNIADSSQSGDGSGALLRTLGKRARERRLGLRLPQVDLAARAGVSRDTIVRLERGDVVGTEALARVAIALGAEAELEQLFPPLEARSLDDILADQRRPQRVRARRAP